MTIRFLAGAILALSATAALADTAGPAPKPKPRGPANFAGFFSPFPFQGGEAIYKGVCQGCHKRNTDAQHDNNEVGQHDAPRGPGFGLVARRTGCGPLIFLRHPGPHDLVLRY